MMLNRSMWCAVLAVLLVVLPLTTLVVVPAVGAADPVLYTQWGTAGFSVPSEDRPAPLDSADTMEADDFVVPAGATWQITQVDVQGERGSSDTDAPPAGMNIFIYTNVSNKPGTRIYSGIKLGYLFDSGNYSIFLPAANPPTLTEGTYWLVVQGNEDAAAQRWRWKVHNSTSPIGQQSQFWSAGASFGCGNDTAGTWVGTNECTSFLAGNSPRNQSFILYGLIPPPPANQPPVNTVPGAQGPVNDNVNLVFSTANGNAISVADPDADPYNVEVSLSVLHGTLTLATTNGIVVDVVDGMDDPSFRFVGTQAAINAALNGLIYNPADGFGGVDTLTITTNDFGNLGSGSAKSDTDTVAIAVKARTTLTLGTNTLQYGGGSVNLNACLDTVVNNADTNLAGQTIVFKFDGTTIATATTTGAGPTASCVNVTSTVPIPNLNAGNYTNRLTAHFAGSTYLLPADDTTSTLTIQRRILWVKPVDREVVLKAANPPTNPNTDPACPAPNRCLELTNGSTFAGSDTWTALNLANLRFSYNRNPPQTNATEFVGKVYKITAIGAVSTNYDVRYQQGNLTVK